MTAAARIRLLVWLILLVFVLIVYSELGSRWRSVPAATASDTLLVIPAGWGSGRIVARLAEAGVLESPNLFGWGLRLQGRSGDLKAGRYLFRRPSSPAALLAQLVGGATEKQWLTLPEGLWLDEAVGHIARSLAVDSLELSRLVRLPKEWGRSFLAGRADLEGFLYPDTYSFEYPATPRAVVECLLAGFEREMGAVTLQAPAGWALAVGEWVTLASIVEAEARKDDERGPIAAVYLNRLRLGMKLEADPTVMYALGERRDRLFFKHLKVDSPYNTYLHPGLPPGPICSPGKSSLRALLLAAPDDPHLYFVADGKGGHLFAITYDEHRRNVERVRAGR